MIGKDLADQLNLPHTKEMCAVYGFDGSKRIAEKSKVTIVLENNDEDFQDDIPIYVLDNDVSLILGRDGIFTRMVVSFDERQHQVTLS